MKKIDTSKKLWLFTIIDFYPSGGMDDYNGSFDSFEEILEQIQIMLHTYKEVDSFQIFYSETSAYEEYDILHSLEYEDEDILYIELTYKNGEGCFTPVYVVNSTCRK
ncbi:hypothetical protein MHB65_20020 [Lysinibacillus sp. FSL K6-0075]|uniref:hypothetical protein n=1 Tax=Lysinibacillus sp. FSL K6-0075 TaxID=2921415 RepID=UPI003159332B